MACQPRSTPLRAATAAGALAAAACLASSPALEPHYYEPALPERSAAPDATAGALRLAPVTARETLRARMVWRRSAVETAFDETHRWAADPEDLVRDALHDALFVHGAYAPAGHAEAPELTLHVAAFEGVLGDPPSARVTLDATLWSADHARTRRFEASVPLPRAGADALAAGIGQALGTVVEELVAWLRSPG